MQDNNGQNNQSVSDNVQLEGWQQQPNQPANQANQQNQAPNQSVNQPLNQSLNESQNQTQPSPPPPQHPPQAPQGIQGGIHAEPFQPYVEPVLDSASANPYQAPNSLNLNRQNGQFIEQNNSTWYHVDGRIGRLRYLSYSIVTPLVLSMGLGMIAGILMVILGFLLGDSGTTIGVVIYVLSMLPGYAFQFIILPRRRLHDLNQSGWFLLIMLIPLVNIIFMLYLCFAPGDVGENDYGLPNRENQWWHYFLGLILPIFYIIAIIGVLAAISIPAYQDYIERSQNPNIEFNQPLGNLGDLPSE